MYAANFLESWTRMIERFKLSLTDVGRCSRPIELDELRISLDDHGRSRWASSVDLHLTPLDTWTQASGELNLHPASRVGPLQDSPYHIRPRRKVEVPLRLDKPSHVVEDGMSKVATQDLVAHSIRVIGPSADGM